ncbi:alpha-1,3-arabinosyltransferase XAT2-like [Amaranthus tricolor]|uniref:alpha-1,3-arabinosyltransferase XAT2-like n=1 Tax=Amaranthus tricolor TaxID=29722 RepID=UPI002587A6FF|nr:alpha-1,3-arabinosyltransferase XAT2-like [Amaranthus tricolor]
MEKLAAKRRQLIKTLAIAALLFFFLFPFFQQSFPSRNSFTLFGYSRKHQIWSKENGINPMGKKEAMKFNNLRRLVRGKDLAQLDSTGVSCIYDFHFEQCIINKPVIIPSNQPMTVYVPSDQPSEKQTVQPYARREDPTAMVEVTPIQILHGRNILTRKNASSYCEVNHGVPAVIFSTGGFIGNMFHELNEIIIPLFITSRHFDSKVQFMITDYADWWVKYKFNKFIKKLSSFEVIDGDSDGRIHCFPSVVIGLRYHDNLALNSSDIPGGYTIADFRKFIGETYNLTIYGPIKPNKRPKILLISRKETRVILNEDEMVKMMSNMGFEIHKSMAHQTIKLDQFVEIVNSCDIIIGAHGAGLTNEVFLRDGAVVIQIVPLALDWASDTYFKSPAHQMGLKYMEYKIGPKESSLYDVYGPNDPIVSDPLVVFENGYRAAKALFIDGQNVTVDLARFKGTLNEVLKYLGYPSV